MFRALCLVALCVSSFLPAAFAQTASITGRVTDPGGAVVPGVTITAKALETGVSTLAVSAQDGYYNLPALLPGTYTLSLEKSGFAAIREENLKLEVQQAVRLDFTLKVGALTETIDISARAPVLDSESATLGQVIESRQVTELPLLGRNPYALAMLVPGVRPSIGVNQLPVDQISSVSFAINGQRATGNEFLLDGAPNEAPAQNQPVINATPDLVQEFKVETSALQRGIRTRCGGRVQRDHQVRKQPIPWRAL